MLKRCYACPLDKCPLTKKKYLNIKISTTDQTYFEECSDVIDYAY